MSYSKLFRFISQFSPFNNSTVKWLAQGHTLVGEAILALESLLLKISYAAPRDTLC